MNNKPFVSWEEVKKELKITKEQEVEIQLEMDLIKAVIEARKKNNLSQRELSEKTGIKQPVIARIENSTNSPQVPFIQRMYCTPLNPELRYSLLLSSTSVPSADSVITILSLAI